MKSAGPWNRKLWGVEFCNSRDDILLLGALWDQGAFERVRTGVVRAGEPTRALLFRTRAMARVWCLAQNTRWRGHGDQIVTHWHCRPVRVREIVEVIR